MPCSWVKGYYIHIHTPFQLRKYWWGNPVQELASCFIMELRTSKLWIAGFMTWEKQMYFHIQAKFHASTSLYNIPWTGQRTLMSHLNWLGFSHIILKLYLKPYWAINLAGFSEITLVFDYEPGWSLVYLTGSQLKKNPFIWFEVRIFLILWVIYIIKPYC